METEFHEGDRVFYPYYGMGTVVADYKTSVPYPIKVVWDKPLFKEEPYSHFSRDGTMSIPLPISNADELKLVLANSVPNEETGGSEMGQIASVTNHEIVQKERGKMQDEGRKFKVGDRVFSFHYGLGVIEDIFDNDDSFPVIVHWEKDPNKAACPDTRNSYTLDGKFFDDGTDSTRDLVLADEDDAESTVEKKSDAKSIEEDKKFMAECKKIDVEGTIFHEGDHGWSPHFGAGVVVAITKDPEDPYPVKVHWVGAVSRSLPEDDYFTKKEEYDYTGANPDMAIYSVEPDHAQMVIPNLINALTKKPEEDTGVVERMEEALNKKVEDAINPSHYRVEGLPEAIDIINHLMHREQYEGFLWGNILKYAYRFGRKGDKAETAGKIAWYANQLKDLEEESYK